MSILRVLGIDGPEDAQFLRRGDAIENVREQPERNHDAIEREEGLEEDVVYAKHVEAVTKECGANYVRHDQDRKLDGDRELVVAVPRARASLENLKAMLAESDDVDEDEDAWAADLEEELSS